MRGPSQFSMSEADLEPRKNANWARKARDLSHLSWGAFCSWTPHSQLSVLSVGEMGTFSTYPIWLLLDLCARRGFAPQGCLFAFTGENICIWACDLLCKVFIWMQTDLVSPPKILLKPSQCMYFHQSFPPMATEMPGGPRKEQKKCCFRDGSGWFLFCISKSGCLNLPYHVLVVERTLRQKNFFLVRQRQHHTDPLLGSHLPNIKGCISVLWLNLCPS